MSEEQMAGKRFQELCELLPEGVTWGDSITPHILDEVLQAALSAKSVPDIVMVTDMNFEGDSHYGTREGDVFVLDDGDVYTYEQLKAEYECEWFYTAPAPQASDGELAVTRNKYGVNITGLPCYVIEYITPLEFVLRNGELADYDSELANRLQELLDWLKAMKGETS